MKTLGKNVHTVELLEVHETERSIYLVLEYISGKSLLESVVKNEYNEIDAREIMKSIL